MSVGASRRAGQRIRLRYGPGTAVSAEVLARRESRKSAKRDIKAKGTKS